MSEKQFALGAVIVLLVLGGWIVWDEYRKEGQRMSPEEICAEIDKIPPGDVKAFRAWLGPQYVHVVNPTDVAACLFARLP